MEETLDEWKEALSNYELALRTIRHNGSQSPDILRRLDNTIYTHLPIKISSRNPHYITASEYTVIVEWKLRREVWRSQTLTFARGANDALVRKASTKAFKNLEQGAIGEAFNVLIDLPGGSPSISSAILSVHDSSVPFMSRELLRVTNGNQINYFQSTLLEVLESVKTKARYLSRRDVTKTWTSVDVEKAIYAQAHLPKTALPHARNNDTDVPSTAIPQDSTEPREEEEGELAPQFSRRKKRISVRRTPDSGGGVEDDMEVVDEMDEVIDESGFSLHMPKSDASNVVG